MFRQILREALVEIQGRGAPGWGPRSRLICLCRQAFSAFADLTIKSLADIEEEVGAGPRVVCWGGGGVPRFPSYGPRLPQPHPFSQGLEIAKSLIVTTPSAFLMRC